MPKILIAELKQEVSSFNPVVSHYDDFDVKRGDAILNARRGGQLELSGALSIFDAQNDIELIPTYSACAITSGGPLADADFMRIVEEFLAAIRTAPSSVDGIYFSLHGAMASVSEDDPEGYVLAKVRELVGDRIPIVVSLDLHGILTDRMLQHVDAIVAYHTYPHVDFFDTGLRSARLLLAIMRGEVRPVTAKVTIPALVRGNELITATGLFGQSIRAAQDIERSVGGLSAGMFIGNPFTDVVALASNSFVITDDDPNRAESEALKLAANFWQIREKLQANLTSLKEAVEIAKAVTGTVIFVDAADATSSGAPGDSNAILRALRQASYKGSVLLPIVDPAAVEAAFRAGIGKTVDITVGGALDPARHQPLNIQATVRLLSDGCFVNESHRTTWNAGNSAVLQAGAATLVVTSRAVSLYDRSLFLAHGQDPRRFDLVVVKSPHCQPQFYDEWATRLLNVDAPGSTSANLRSLGHRRVTRPIYPLDEHVTYTPQARLFRR